MYTSVVKWLLVALLLANVLVVVAWLNKERLVAAGLLQRPPPNRVDLPPQPLPAVVPIIPAAGVASATEQAHEPAVPDGDALLALACVIAGPFEDGALAADLRLRIESAGGSADVGERRIPAPSRYLVYVRPAATGEIAARTSQALRAQAIDTYVIPSGERQHGVSVGIFSMRDLAVAQQQRVAELGYRVLVHEQRRRATVHFVRADVPPGVLGDTPHVGCSDDGDGNEA